MTESHFVPEDFLKIADLIASGDEAALRTAVGRVYYAAFLVAREVTGVSTRRNVHDQIARTLNEMGEAGLASQLGTLRHLREVADYELVPREPANRDWQRNWQQARRNAIRVLSRLRELQDRVGSADVERGDAH